MFIIVYNVTCWQFFFKFANQIEAKNYHNFTQKKLLTLKTKIVTFGGYGIRGAIIRGTRYLGSRYSGTRYSGSRY